MAVLKLLAGQAATSLETSSLYRELQEREAEIRRLVDSNIVGIFIWDLEGRILDANDAFLQIIGYEREDLRSGRLRWTDLTPPEILERELEELLPRIKLAGSLKPWEKEYFHKDGHRVPVLIGVAPFDDESSRGAAFIVDLTERKRAEQRVLAQHRTTRILAEAATVEEAAPKILLAVCECLGWDLGAWWRIDREADVLRCAELWRSPSVEAAEFEAATRASTFPPGSGLPGRVWASGVPACIPDVVQDPAFIRAGVAAREGLHAAFAFPILLGGEVLGVIDFVSREVREPDENLLDTMATLGSQIGQFIDRKRAENALQVARTELAHVTRVTTVGELTASIAHEVRQPIAASVTSAQTALRWLDAQPPELGEVREALSRIVRAGKRAGDVIGRIRALVTKAPPRNDLVEINAAIREVIELTRGEAVENGVTVRTELAEGLPLTRGDRVQLQQVVLNLIINGIEAMAAASEASRDLLISTSRDGTGAVLVAVADTGPGLTAEALKHLFAAFYTTKPGGLGLGLSICRSIIEAHEGRLWASANDPHGARFELSLPVRPDGDR